MTRHSPMMRASNRSTLFAWIAFAAFCAGFVVCMLAIERQRQQRAVDYRRSKAVMGEIRRRIYLGRAVTPQSLAQDFNHGAPLPSRAGAYSGFVDVTLAGELIKPDFAGWHVILTFRNDHSADTTEAASTAGPEMMFSGLDPTSRLRYARLISDRTYSADAPALWYKAQTLRRMLVGVAAVAWIGGVSLLFVAGQWRRKVAQICLAIAIVGLIGIVVDPTFSSQTRTGCTELPLAMVVVLTSVLLVFLPPGLVGGDLRHCQSCGYDLHGNQSGVCPECGTPTPAFSRRSRLAGFEGYAQAIESADLSDRAEPDVFVPLFAADAA